MSKSTKQSTATLDEQVLATLGGGKDGSEPADLRTLVERAGDDLDARAAEELGAALIARLSSDPDASRELQALVVLGLAHPKALAKQDVALSQEGRRLAGLLERGGEVDRAQALLELLVAKNPGDRMLDHELASIMQRTGNADRLVERYLRRAEEAIRQGRRGDAVTWLREALSVDRSRRDVARMIRDLRYEEAEKRRAWRRRVRAAVAVLLLAGAVVGAVWRETWLRQQYNAIAPAADADLTGLRTRLGEIDALVARSPLWLGAFQASRERAEMRAQIARIEAEQLRARMAAEAEMARRLDEAESAHVRGRSAIEQGDLAAGMEHYRHALEVAPEGWEQRTRLKADVEAIQTWLRQNRGAGGD